jgi:hypothetical protein
MLLLIFGKVHHHLKVTIMESMIARSSIVKQYFMYVKINWFLAEQPPQCVG